MTTYSRQADDQLAWRLTAYANIRLSPSPEATARMRAAVMAAAAGLPARTATQAPPATRTPEPIAFAAHRARFGFSGRSRAVAGLLAASLSLLLMTGVAFAASPGGPLYGARLWVETVSLPSEPGARADADADRLDSRLKEAVGAARSGNGSATAAALGAYRDILDDAMLAAGKSESRTLRLEAALARHQLVLATLLEYAPDRARDALQRAIERSDQAVKGIGAGRGDKGDRPSVRPTPRTPNAHGPGPKSKPGSDGRP
jgi:hypothetical protein